MICGCFCVPGTGLVVIWRGHGYIIAALFPHVVSLNHAVSAMRLLLDTTEDVLVCLGMLLSSHASSNAYQ